MCCICCCQFRTITRSPFYSLRTTLPRIPFSVNFCVRICQWKNLHEIWKAEVKQKVLYLEYCDSHTWQASKLLKFLLLSCRLLMVCRLPISSRVFVCFLSVPRLSLMSQWKFLQSFSLSLPDISRSPDLRNRCSCCVSLGNTQTHKISLLPQFSHS